MNKENALMGTDGRITSLGSWVSQQLPHSRSHHSRIPNSTSARDELTPRSKVLSRVRELRFRTSCLYAYNPFLFIPIFRHIMNRHLHFRR